MNQNISLQIFDELGKAFDWHQISDFNCHGTKYLFSVDLKNIFLSWSQPPYPCHPCILFSSTHYSGQGGFQALSNSWLKKTIFFDPNITRLLSHSLALLTSYPIIMISNMVNFQVLILFSISSVKNVCFWNWVSYITSSHCFCSCCCYCCPFKWL